MKKEDKKNFCPYCDYTGIVHNQGFELLGENVLNPCPKCVIPTCKCKGEDPYYFYDGENIIPCPCRDVRMKIDRVISIYYSSGIGKYFRWKTWGDFKPESELAQKAYSTAYDIVMNLHVARFGSRFVACNSGHSPLACCCCCCWSRYRRNRSNSR